MSLRAVKIAIAAASAFALAAAAPVFATTASNSFSGTVATVVPCDNLTNSSLVVLQSGAAYTFQGQFSLGPTGYTVPQTGEIIYGTYENGPYCFSSIVGNSSMQSILLYATSSLANTAPAASQPVVSNPVPSINPLSSLTGGIGNTLFSSVRSLLSGLFSSSAGATKTSTSIPFSDTQTLGAAGSQTITTPSGFSVSQNADGTYTITPTGSQTVTLPSSSSSLCPGALPPTGTAFGGIIVSPPVPCINPPGSWMVVLGPPNPGPYMYIPGGTHTCKYVPPAAPGQWVTGNAIPYTCVTGTPPAPIPVSLMTIEGTSLP